MNAIDSAASVLRMFDIEPAPLDRLLGSYLSRHPELNSRQRRLASRAVYGVARWRRRIEACLRLSKIKAQGPRELAEAYLRWRPCDDFEKLRGTLGLAPALDALDIEAVPRENFPGGDAAYYSYPDFLYEIFVLERGASGAAELAARLNEPLGPTLRVNVLAASREEAAAGLLAEGVGSEPTARSPFGLRLSMRSNLRALDSFRSGIFEIQDEASQIVSILADPRSGWRVLDACAGAGGKSLAMAVIMQDRGEIVAFDPERSKLKELAKRAARAGARSVRTAQSMERASSQGPFDLVVVDAPCSGTGTLRRSPDIRWRLSGERIELMAAGQGRIISANAQLVKPGGRLLYATCSLLARENERVVEGFLEGGGFSVLDASAELSRLGIDPDGIVDDRGFLSTDPRVGEWDGFFAALLMREG